jgi:hypothetical protein
MVFPPRWRKLALTAHVGASVGWLGAVAAFLVLAVIGLRSIDDTTVRSLYPTLDLLGWYVIVPFSVAALVTGLIQSLGTQWGFFKHYWVVAKLLITVGASLLLLLHMQLVRSAAAAAGNGALASEQRTRLVADAAAALVVLAIAVALSVYKPQGLTPWAARAESSGVVAVHSRQTAFSYLFWFTVGALLVAVIIRHLLGGAMQSHFSH